MCRTAIFFVALAALTATAARGTQASTASTHRKSPAATSTHSVHATHRRAGASGAHRATTAHSSTSSHPSHQSSSPRSSNGRVRTATEHKQSADEVGWRAGLAIRRQRARRQATLRTARYEIHRSVPRARADDATGANDAANDNDQDLPGADESAMANSPTAQRSAPGVGDGPKAPGSRNAPKAQPADTQEAMNTGSASAEKPALPGTTTSETAPVASGADASASADDDVKESQAPPPTEAASVRTENEEAMLRMPRGGMPSPLRGSLESLERQNAKLDAEGLERIEDESDLAARIANGLLVPVPVSSALTVNSDLLENHRYCRPWTARFLSDLARAHEALFHKPLMVSSAVRTVEYQRRLTAINGNAAPAEGDVVSPHLTGATVDIAKSGLSRQEMAWMRQRLLALQSAGKIDVEEEFRQACFHITVYKNYMPEHTPKPGVRHAAPSTESPDDAAQGM
jgi:hypothetical protein